MDIKRIAKNIIDISDSKNVEHIIKREFLQVDCDNFTKRSKFSEFCNSKWIASVLEEQNIQGNWGRFHTSNSKVKSKYPTTEYALKYLYYLGLRRGDEPIDRACSYMEFLLNNKEHWSDAWESNRWFGAGVDLFIMSSLSQFGSDEAYYQKALSNWIQVLESSFRSGEYNSKDCNETAKRLLGVDIHDSYIGLNSIKTITLFAFNEAKIPKDLKIKYINWLYTYPKNIFYMSVNLSNCQFDYLVDGELTDWVLVMGLLSKFDGFIDVFYKEIDELSFRIQPYGLWDLGNAFKKFKISDSWRKEQDRLIDQSIYILRILNNHM